MGVQDYQEALKWFKILADNHNHTEAQYYLGQMFEKGQAVPPDYVKALEWYHKAAAKKHKPSEDKIKEISEMMAGIKR